MAAADFNSSSLSINQPCKCYRVPSLDGTILDANEISSLNDRYVLGEQLGWGQFGVIRACTDRFTGELLACKSIAKDRLVTADDVRSVKHEIEIMTRLSGLPNVVDLKAVYEDWDYVHLVMELCAGGELFLLLEKHGRFSEFEARFIFRQLMQVVSYCHEIGIVHRDLKPENILLARKTSSSSIKLADFGLATYIKKGQSLHGTVGSPFYIAPEVLSGGYNEAADVWSTGVILYILLSGMPPFWGKTKSRIFDSVRAADLNFPSDPWDQINESAKDLIRGMLCIDPLQRLTAQQVLGHSWMKDDEQFPGVPSNSKKQVCSEWEFGGGSFSLYMSRDQDISFGKESPVISDVHSPTFTCRSSCVSCHDEPSTTPGVSDGFSFPSTDNTNALELSSGLSSMPSFAFFSPGPLIDQGSCKLDHLSNSSGIDSVLEEASLDKVIMTRESSLCCGREAQKAENKPVDVKRAGGNLASRMFGIQSKRNRTIGFGEREQLDIMATESVIRWASCTNLPTTSSLRSSLVC